MKRDHLGQQASTKVDAATNETYTRLHIIVLNHMVPITTLENVMESDNIEDTTPKK